MQLNEARKIALEICYFLQPVCVPQRLNLAGSIRRKKKEVKDIEIICLPQLATGAASLFGDPDPVRSPEFLTAVKSLGKIEKGNPRDGKYLKFQLLDKSEKPLIALDLFIPDTFDYFRQYAIRTGSADYAQKHIAAAWLRKGWCGSDKGLRLQSDCVNHKKPDGKNDWRCVNPNAEKPPVWESEEDFFNWVGSDWIPPEARFFS